MMMSLCALEEDVERKELYQQVVGELKGELVIQCIKGVPRFITISELQVLLSIFWLPFTCHFHACVGLFPHSIYSNQSVAFDGM